MRFYQNKKQAAVLRNQDRHSFCVAWTWRLQGGNAVSHLSFVRFPNLSKKGQATNRIVVVIDAKIVGFLVNM